MSLTLSNLTSCSNCVLDSSAPEIQVDEHGICNFCYQAQKALTEIANERPNINKVIEQIKKDGKGKTYDVLCGLSGGIDSSYALYCAVKLGLRPLCYTVDNGWNKPVADENILKMVEGLKVPFYRKTINEEQFLKLQGAFMEAGVKNIEIPSDHLILATSLELASKYKIKWFLSGGNVATESIMPTSWGWNARDLTHIKDIYKWATGKRLKGLPVCGILKWNKYRWLSNIKTFYILDYLYYDLKKSKETLRQEFGWEDYGEKHEESKFTHWFQSFYLPRKFDIDKRKAHFSSLINSGQMTRNEALEKLKEERDYPKMVFENKVLQYKNRDHSEFKQDKWYDRIAKICTVTGISRLR